MPVQIRIRSRERPHSALLYHSGEDSSRHEGESSSAYDHEDHDHDHDHGQDHGHPSTWPQHYEQRGEEEEDEDDQVLPSDSASIIQGGPVPRSRASRHHRVRQPPPQNYPVAQGPRSPSVGSSEEYGQFGQSYAHHLTARGYYGGRGQHPGYQQQGHYYPPGNQMVGFPGAYGPTNPFTPMNNAPNGASYFGGEPRPPYDLMPYQQPHQTAFFAGPHYSLPAGLQQFHITAPATQPAPKEPPAKPATPAPKEPPPDLEKIKLEAEIAAIKAQEARNKADEERRAREAQIRKEAEEAFQRRMDVMKKAQEEAQKEIQQARAEADRMARERVAAELKAEEERKKNHIEAMRRAEESARIKIEAEFKAAEIRRQKDEEVRLRAEDAARKRLEAAIKAEADAKAAAEKKAAEEAERLKIAQEDAKRKAEVEIMKKLDEEKAAAKKAAEAAEAAKAEQEAFKKRIQEETKVSLEEAAKKKEQAHITFKDAVGRKFSFPFHLCATWQGMEELIKQAFLQVDVLGQQVQRGHYDLIGPNSEIILPAVWEKVIQPNWNVTMTIWPPDRRTPFHPMRPVGGPFPNFPNHSRHGPPGQRPDGGVVPPRSYFNPDIIQVEPKADKQKETKKNKPSVWAGIFGARPSGKTVRRKHRKA